MDQIWQLDEHLLRGCVLEADRSDVVSYRLEGLRNALIDISNPHLTAVIEEIRSGSRILRELADLSQVHLDRVPLLLNPLNIVLPSLSRSLRDVTAHYEDRSRPKFDRWCHMYHSMTIEAGGLPLPGRFMAYNQYLSLVRDMLVRSPNFDLNMLEKLGRQILQLREARGIPPPPIQIGPLVRFDSASHDMDPLEISRPPFSWGHLDIPVNSKILFRRSFNDDRISLTVYRNSTDRCPYLLLRTLEQGNPWFSLRGAHELCIERDGSSLQLKRWSRMERRPKTWAVLYFMTWEELVLTHSTFVSLKARNSLTISLDPEEYTLRDEKKLFRARILDDSFTHSLFVYQDLATRALRLHAAVLDGELHHCPVWTAFVTHQSASPTWLKRVSRHRVRLADVQLYVFCRQYRPQSQRRGPGGSFEINFMGDQDAQRFEEVFHRYHAGSAAVSTEG